MCSTTLSLQPATMETKPLTQASPFSSREKRNRSLPATHGLGRCHRDKRKSTASNALAS